MKIRIKTPAFITYDFHRKANGFKYTMLPVSLFDVLTIEKINERKIHIKKSGKFKIPTNDSNPVYKIAALLQKKKPNKLGAIISIQKNIPSFSGLSSQAGNAAGALIALNKLWGFDLSERELGKIGSKICPKITEILKSRIKKTKKNPQKAALALLKYIKTDARWMENGIKSRNAEGGKVYQDMAFRHFPDLKKMDEAMKKAGYKQSGMSGKGPVIFGLSDKTPNAISVKKTLSEKSDFFWFGKSCNKWGELLE